MRNDDDEKTTCHAGHYILASCCAKSILFFFRFVLLRMQEIMYAWLSGLHPASARHQTTTIVPMMVIMVVKARHIIAEYKSCRNQQANIKTTCLSISITAHERVDSHSTHTHTNHIQRQRQRRCGTVRRHCVCVCVFGHVRNVTSGTGSHTEFHPPFWTKLNGKQENEKWVYI